MKGHDRKWRQMGLVKIEIKAAVQDCPLFECSVHHLRDEEEMLETLLNNFQVI